MSGCPHTSTFTGKRVFIRKRDGTTLIGRFVERRSGRVIVNAGTPREPLKLSIDVCCIVSMSIYREPAEPRSP